MKLRNSILATAFATVLLASTALTGLTQTEGSSTATVAISSDPNQNFLAVTITNASFGSKAYSFVDQTAVGSLLVTATDSRGTATGWNVTLSASDFVSGPNTFDIHFLSLSAGTPNAVLSGGTTGTMSGVNATSAAPVQETGTSTTKILAAGAGSGSGQYSLPMAGSLTIPGGTLVGNYASTVSVAIVSGP